MKTCTRCGENKELTFFSKKKQYTDGLHIYCKDCSRSKGREWYHNNRESFKKSHKKWVEDNRDKQLLTNVKCRARKRGIVFDLEHNDIYIPSLCPALGIPLYFSKVGRSDHTPSIDRIDNCKGYTKENIQIISDKANRMKNNASKEELHKFADWIKSNV